MKLTILFLLLSVFCAMASSSYSQSKKLNFDVKDATVEDVITNIENQSEFYFLYSEKVIDVDRKVSLDIENQNITSVLNELFAGTNVAYAIKDKIIVLSTPDVIDNVVPAVWQQTTISGVVTDENNLPLPGVTVVVKGTSKGTVTNSDGSYSLASVPNEATLVFSFVGMRTEEIEVGNQTRINVTMETATVGLDEVIAIGYGTRQKRDLTGAVSQIESEELVKEIKMSPELAMQGKMAGVYISNPGSSPYARPTVRIRGVGTLGYNDPLYVIDGIPVTEGWASSDFSRDIDIRSPINIVNMINPNDIESISVLKDASATAIYGVRASNGVILITTKRGSKGKAKVDVSARYGVQNIYHKYDVLDVEDYVMMHNEAWANNDVFNESESITRFYDSSNPNYLGNNGDYRDDWMDANTIENAPVQDYNINVSGGTDMSNYSVGVGYSSQEDVQYKQSFERYSLFLNSDHQIADWLKVGESYRFIYSASDQAGGAGFQNATFINPWQPLYDGNEVLGLARPGRTIDGEFVTFGYGNSTRDNFLAGKKLNSTRINYVLRNMGSIYAEVTPLKGLRIKGTYSFDYYTNTEERYSPAKAGLYSATTGVEASSGNTFGKGITENKNLVKEFLVGYNGTFGKHNIDVIGNITDQEVSWILTSYSIGNNSPITSFDQRRIDEGWPSEDKRLFYEPFSSGLQGYMGRLSYNYDSKYYIDATVRRDGSSKFGPGYKWGTFPSFAAAWRISSEAFMQDITWLDDLKIRAGWGQSGNQETDDFAFLSLVNFNPKYATGDAGTVAGEGNIVPAAALGDFPIVDMSWETATTINVGFDAVLFDNSTTFTAEYYNRNTDGILQQINIPMVIGALNNPYINLAEVMNQGFEFQGSYSNSVGDLNYNVSANLTTVKNEVKKLYRNTPQGSGNLRIEEGYPINYIYGYKMGGIFQTPEEVEEYQSDIEDPGNDAQKAPGDIWFQDLNGPPTEEDGEDAYVHYEPDGIINDYDRTYLGKTIPGFYYGFNINADYKNWDISINFRGVGDVQKVNTMKQAGESMSAGGANYLTSVLGRWTESKKSTSMPRAMASDPSGNNRFSDRWVEDAGFLKLQNLQIGYNFSGSVLERIGVDNLRSYVSGSNLMTLTSWSGLDPENDTTPVVFTLGVNLSF